MRIKNLPRFLTATVLHMVAEGCAFLVSLRPMYETSDWAESEWAVSVSYSELEVSVRVMEVPEVAEVREPAEVCEWSEVTDESDSYSASPTVRLRFIYFEEVVEAEVADVSVACDD